MSALRVDVLTLFPGIFESPLPESILGRAIQRGLLDVEVHDIREHAHDKHRTTDDYAFGGGPGMVMKPEPIFEAVEALDPGPKRVILLSPAGRRFDQAMARELATESRLVLICGRYEGVDQRVRDHLVTRELSIGDYVLTGGELAAAVVVDVVARLIPGVIEEQSLDEESFSDGLLEYPHYTRPASYRGWGVPEILLSGDHERVRAWRLERSRERASS